MFDKLSAVKEVLRYRSTRYPIDYVVYNFNDQIIVDTDKESLGHTRSLMLDDDFIAILKQHEITHIDKFKGDGVTINYTTPEGNNYIPRQSFEEVFTVITESNITNSNNILSHIPKYVQSLYITSIDATEIAQSSFKGSHMVLMEIHSQKFTNLSKLLTMNYLQYIRIIQHHSALKGANISNIVNKHLKMGSNIRQRDIPGFEQEMIDAGFEDYL